MVSNEYSFKCDLFVVCPLLLTDMPSIYRTQVIISNKPKPGCIELCELGWNIGIYDG